VEIKVITDLSSEPVTTAIAKNYVKASYGTDAVEEALIASMVKAARQLIEEEADRSLGEKTIDIFFHADEIQAKRVRLPAGPHGDFTHVKSINQEGTETTLTLNTDYYKRGLQFKELEFLSASVNPWSEGDSVSDDYVVRLVAGYGISETTEDLPEGFKQAILKQVAEWYVNREDYVPVLSSGVKRILKQLSGNSYL